MGKCFPKTSLEQVKTLSDIVGGMYFFFYLFIYFKEHYFYHSIHSVKTIIFGQSKRSINQFIS